MSIEAALAELTAAVKENTAAHAKLAEVAAAAAGGKAAAPAKAPAKDEAPAEEKKPAAKAAAKPAAKAAAKKPAAKKVEPPELAGSVTHTEIAKIGAAFLKGDDEEARDAAKSNFIAGLQHIGAAKLGEIDSDEDRARLAGYIAYWTAGLEVDFEAIDEIVLAAGGDDEGSDDEGSDDDDILG
ncbi:hypothetical protein DSS3P1_79 [Ruegeria phage DSS3-P1]|uniref:hypothetical protein n=1 Tax=Ruegeria phage DSS3-P1 TaxID=1555208 RepID=UPI00051AA976|nr:hypothetical protein DSS3P1_79 [Ruegeria phage DSS3-P1]YP_009997215.1 hypothetical protein JT311_gp81 [Ruegeria phage vB_RpoS-V16]YP_009997296.1 hypothetical protein JT312_gp79 [Ruegeria phage vB_RpoS-V18]YP_009997378.1 hypothetical protein JT313_gp79 [Ruegeria phage vB_RpoS-V11]YP_009997462.1 hypothetical protein JT314_gp81 [Ruegeria phage vB_RpoS-V7]AIT13314.1 hypothetical protein DSS3P1_79 [Ruegeria phage DSS3-P1]AWY08784.1 hypothetical protein vBRpoSV7_81 [Ruegeria phage vB_RpoS-V7]AW